MQTQRLHFVVNFVLTKFRNEDLRKTSTDYENCFVSALILINKPVGGSVR